MLVELVDTTDGPNVVRQWTGLRGPAAVAGYGGAHNRFQNAGELFAAFPRAHHVLVVADSRDHPKRAAGVLVVLDIEPGNNTPDVAGWIRTERREFGVRRPPLYFPLALGVQVMRDLHRQGLNAPQDYKVWAARPNGVPELTSPGAFPGWVVTSDATQYLWSPRKINVDVSVCTLDFLHPEAIIPPAPPAKPPAPKPTPFRRIPAAIFPLRRRAYNNGFQDGAVWQRTFDRAHR